MHHSHHLVSKRRSLNEFRIFLCKMYVLIFCRKYQTTWRAARGRGLIRSRGRIRVGQEEEEGGDFKLFFFSVNSLILFL